MNNKTTTKSAGRPNYSARKAQPTNDIAAGSAMPPGSLPFNAVVQLTVDAENRARARDEAMKRDEARTRAELSGMYLPRFKPMVRGVDYEDDYVPPPRSAGPPKPDYEGFTEVKKKTRKSKRELTTAELNQKMTEPPSDDEDGEYNADLYDNARQHEHY